MVVIACCEKVFKNFDAMYFSLPLIQVLASDDCRILALQFKDYNNTSGNDGLFILDVMWHKSLPMSPHLRNYALNQGPHGHLSWIMANSLFLREYSVFRVCNKSLDLLSGPVQLKS